MILLAAYAGLRVSEIAAIKGDDVDTITVNGKGDKERQIPLHPILKDLAAVMPGRGWWFPTYVGNTKHLAGGPMLGNSVSSSISNAMDRAGMPAPPTPSATGSAPPSATPASTPWSSKNSWDTNPWPPQRSMSTFPSSSDLGVVVLLPRITLDWRREHTPTGVDQLALFD